MFLVLLIFLVIVCFLLVSGVLMQAGTGGGLAAMGGGASTDTFLGGRQATTILTKGTWWMGGIFLGVCLILAVLSTQSATPRSVLEGEQLAPTPVAPQQQLPLDVEPQPQRQTPDPN